MSRREQIARWITAVHDDVTAEFGRLDPGGTFAETRWERADGSRGVARAMIDGAAFDIAAIDRCCVQGLLPPLLVSELSPSPSPTDGSRFFGAAQSLYAEPRHTDVPTANLVIRYVEITDRHEHVTDSWFGGAATLSSEVLADVDARHVDEQLGQLCDRVHPALYARVRLAPGESATRTRAGIEFDQLRADGDDLQLSFAQLVMFLGDLTHLFGCVCARALSRDRSGIVRLVRPVRATSPARLEQDFAFLATGAPGTSTSFEAQLALMLGQQAWEESGSRG